MTTRKNNMLTLDEIKERLYKVHPYIEVLDTEYFGTRYKLNFRCKLDGCEWKGQYNNTLTHKYACRKCHSRNVSGENSVNWEGGITEINAYLRRGSNKWKARALKNQMVCQISGADSELEVHHLYPAFHTIAKNVFKNTGIDIRENVSKYSDEELKTLLYECERLHEGCMSVVWTKGIHKEFHRLYGYPENSFFKSTLFIVRLYAPFREDGDDESTHISVFKNRLLRFMMGETDEQTYNNTKRQSLYDLPEDNNSEKKRIKLREERIMRRLNNSNNFFGKLHGMKAEDFYNCLDRGLRTYEERLESVNNMFYPNGVLHPYWEGVFEQPEGGVGNIKLLLNSSDTIYSESNVATVLNAVGTYLLEPFMNDDDNVEYKIFTDYRLFKEAIRHLSYEQVTEEKDNTILFNMEEELLYFREKKNFKKEVKQVINPNDYCDPQIGMLLENYRKISDAITLKKNMIRDLKALTTKQILELDDYYRAYILDSGMGVPKTGIWTGKRPDNYDNNYESIALKSGCWYE